MGALLERILRNLLLSVPQMAAIRAFVGVGHSKTCPPRPCYRTPDTMALKALILLTLLSRTPYHRDTETWEEREERLELVADAIHDSATRATCTETHKKEGCKVIWPYSSRSISMLLVEQAVSETNLSHLIHDNQCRLEIGECDAAKVWSKKKGRYNYFQQSFSLWQLKRFRDVSMAAWKKIESGRPGTHQAAWLATRRLAGGLSGCGSIEGAIARYATGKACKWEDAPKRYALYQSLMNTNRDAMEKSVKRHEKTVRRRTEEKPHVVASRD